MILMSLFQFFLLQSFLSLRLNLLVLLLNKILLERCDELWVFGKDITQGMEKEIAYAKKIDIPMKWFKEAMEQ